MPSDDTPATESVAARIWDAPIRLFHWLLVALLGFSWWSGKHHTMDWHRLSGYCILALLIFRIYWGFVGGRTARFTQFVRGPRAVYNYARSFATHPHPAAPGHNPAGGWSVVVMLVVLMTMVVAGLFAVDVDGLESGPLADYVSFDQGRIAAHVHGLVFNLLLGLGALHVLAILFYLVRLRRNLIVPMITGRAPSTNGPADDLRASPWTVLLGVVLAGLCSYAIAHGFRL